MSLPFAFSLAPGLQTLSEPKACPYAFPLDLLGSVAGCSPENRQ